MVSKLVLDASKFTQRPGIAFFYLSIYNTDYMLGDGPEMPTDGEINQAALETSSPQTSDLGDRSKEATPNKDFLFQIKRWEGGGIYNPEAHKKKLEELAQLVPQESPIEVIDKS